MSHVRKQIRDAVKTAVTGLATTGANVYQGRNARLLAGNLPFLMIYVNGETVDYDDEGASMGPPSPARVIDLRIQAYTEAIDSLNEVPYDELDQVAAEVETAIYVDETFGGLAFRTEVGDSEISTDNEGEQQLAILDMGFNVSYRAVEGLPEVAV